MTPKWINLDSTKPLRFTKQAIYAGQFNKDGDEFEVSTDMLSRLADSVQELRTAGIDVPFTNSHDWMNSANRLGDIVSAKVEDNEQGIPALYLGVEFADEASRDIALKADVSIGYLSEFLDGKGVLHEQVLRHVASTSAPVISALSDWAALAASFQGKDNSNMNQLLAQLGVESEEAAITLVKDLQEKAATVTEKVELSHNPKIVRKMLDLRLSEVSNLLKDQTIGKVMHDRLVKDFCTDKMVALELSATDETCEYDRVVELIKLQAKNPPVATHGRSFAPGQNEVVLSHAGGDKWLDRFATWSQRHNTHIYHKG